MQYTEVGPAVPPLNGGPTQHPAEKSLNTGLASIRKNQLI